MKATIDFHLQSVIRDCARSFADFGLRLRQSARQWSSLKFREAGPSEGIAMTMGLAQETVPGFPTAAAANAVLEEAERRGISVDPMKLQKLIYFAHGYYLAVTNRPWIDELFEAWQYGPVVPSVYHEFKRFGASPIPKGCRASRLITSGLNFRFEEPEAATKDDETGSTILNYVLDTYGSKSAIYLSDITHKIGSPWHNVRREAQNQDIPNQLVKDYFSTMVKKKQA